MFSFSIFDLASTEAENMQDCSEASETLLSSQCENILDVKRVVLNEQMNEVVNVTFAATEHSRNMLGKLSFEFKTRPNTNSKNFWKEAPYTNKKNLVQVDTEQLNLSTKTSFDNKNMTRKYFYMWKDLVRLKRQSNLFHNNRAEQKEKLNKFIKQLKKCKIEEQSKPLADKQIASRSNYKNRFSAQKTIIDMQRSKLEEQNKIIEELKLGIIKEDLLKSIENTKASIREIFAGCSEKFKCKLPIALVEDKFSLDIKKAPKLIQQIEQRALERAHNREIILERKRIIEETRQRMLEEAIERKKTLEDEEKMKQLEMMKERRRKELEHEKIRQKHKQRYLECLDKAVRFHNSLLEKQCFSKLYKNMVIAREKNLRARHHYTTKVLKKYFCCWTAYIESFYKIKHEIADAHFAYKILRKTLAVWYKEHRENVRNIQVAEDFYDFRLTSNTFIHWHRYVCMQIIAEDKKLKIAEEHYQRRIIFHCFYQWRSLKAILELEKAIELKKRKWREKVWEVLPDYKPPKDA